MNRSTLQKVAAGTMSLRNVSVDEAKSRLRTIRKIERQNKKVKS